MSFKNRIEQALCSPHIVERIATRDVATSNDRLSSSEFSTHPSFVLYGKGFHQQSVSVKAVPTRLEGFIPLTHTPTGYRWIGGANLPNHPRRRVHVRGFESSPLIVAEQWNRVTGWSKGNVAPQLPLTNIGWLDAVLFCNAYSQMLFLDPVYDLPLGTPFNLPHAVQVEILANMKVDTLVNGFRLPSELEWECLMLERATKSAISKYGEPIQCQEWCSDEYGVKVLEQDENPSYTSVWRSVRGGDSSMNQQKRLLSRSQMLGYQSSSEIAFRIVRTKL